jgi:bifunctional DNA-binding transcriptional regulator/antitoxin component of YhaV-PrlF toxin-antitoxin module
MVLPKEIREKAGIQAGDKLALVSWERADNIKFIALIKAKDLNVLVQKMMEPVLKEAAK